VSNLVVEILEPFKLSNGKKTKHQVGIIQYLKGANQAFYFHSPHYQKSEQPLNSLLSLTLTVPTSPFFHSKNPSSFLTSISTQSHMHMNYNS
jgi:hypothetical protein